MPQPALTDPERRLAAFCRLSATVYFAAALFLAAFPVTTTDVFAAAAMAAAATACLVTAARPRERRHAILPVAAAQLAACALAAAHLIAGTRSVALTCVVAIGVPLLTLTLAMYRAAAPGVHSEPAREGPPLEEDPPKIQLKVSKS